MRGFIRQGIGMPTVLWGAFTVIAFVGVLLVNLYLVFPVPPVWLRVLEYLLVGTLLLAWIARARPAAGSFVWRPLMLVLGSALAAGEVAAWSRFHRQPFSIDQWMASLIGIALIAILARFLPPSVLGPWLKVDAGTALPEDKPWK